MLKEKLFEIDLYNYSPERFNKKVYNKWNWFMTTKTFEDKERIYGEWFQAMNEYINYRVGVLEIFYNGFLEYNSKIMITHKELKNENIEVEEGRYRRNEELNIYKMPLFTEKKHYMSNYPIMGFHTDVEGKSNAEIVSLIKKDINEIRCDEMFNNIYFDVSEFEKIAPYFDFITYFNYLSKGTH